MANDSSTKPGDVIQGDDPNATPVDKPGVPPVTYLNDKGESVTVPKLREGDPVGPVPQPETKAAAKDAPKESSSKAD